MNKSIIDFANLVANKLTLFTLVSHLVLHKGFNNQHQSLDVIFEDRPPLCWRRDYSRTYGWST